MINGERVIFALPQSKRTIYLQQAACLFILNQSKISFNSENQLFRCRKTPPICLLSAFGFEKDVAKMMSFRHNDSAHFIDFT
jgi:hypothetical protein